MRYIPITPDDRDAMLRTIGVRSTDDLFADIPPAVRLQRPLDLPPARSEMEVLQYLRDLAAQNANIQDHACFLGCGAYDHYIPSVVDHIIRRGEFLTAYTPYQPEISQGVLQSIYEWQTLICELTAMDVANASMYDGASATAEAAIMALSLTGRKKLVVCRTVHPDYRRVIRTYTSGLGVEVVEVPLAAGATDPDQAAALVDGDTAALVVQTPNFFGCLEPVHELADLVHRHGGLLVVVPDPYSLGILEAPGNYGADIVAMECQALGNPVSYGGPYVGVIATRQAFVRRLPGRIVGATVDSRGQRGYVLTLQAREQHIRREKATSNICTNQALNALAATVTLCWLGPEGLRQAAELCLQKAHWLAEQVAQIPGWRLAFPGTPFFKEFAVVAPVDPAAVNRHLLERHRILGGYHPRRDYPELGNLMIFCVTEKRTRAEMDRLLAGLREVS